MLLTNVMGMIGMVVLIEAAMVVMLMRDRPPR
jgi:hypothetical protein